MSAWAPSPPLTEPPLTTMGRHNPLISSTRRFSRDTDQQHSGARLRSRTDNSTRDQHNCCFPLGPEVWWGFPPVYRYKLYTSTRYQFYAIIRNNLVNLSVNFRSLSAKFAGFCRDFSNRQSSSGNLMSVTMRRRGANFEEVVISS